VQTRLKTKGLSKEKTFSVFSETDARTGEVEELNQYQLVPSDRGTEGRRSCLGREFQSTGAWWVQDLSVALRPERTEGRCRAMMSEERVVRLD